MNRPEFLTMVSELGAEDIFDVLMPNHYAEVYTLYTLLKRLEISVDEIGWKLCRVENEKVIFSFSIDKRFYNKLHDYIDKVDTLQFLSKHQFIPKLTTLKKGSCKLQLRT